MKSGLDYFTKYDAKAEELYDAEKYAEAIEFLEPAYKEFPEQYFFISWRSLICYRFLGRFDKCLEIIKDGVQRGYFFNVRFKNWDPLREVDGAKAALAENDRLKTEAQKSAVMKYEVHTPDGYTPEKPSPLFFAMHCDSGFFGNIEEHRRRWKPEPMLKRGFIVVYLQSSQLMASGGSEWEGDYQQARRDIRQCCDAVTASYAVDTGKVIASGFSGGASASIDIALNGNFPVKGFIALCPNKPKDFSGEICAKAVERGVRGVIMEGEVSDVSDDIKEMEAGFNEVGFPYQLTINKSEGHWYPPDLPEKLDQSMAFILDSQQ
jgi:tetratricopeptide (TPR) repeat protein